MAIETGPTRQKQHAISRGLRHWHPDAAKSVIDGMGGTIQGVWEAVAPQAKKRGHVELASAAALVTMRLVAERPAHPTIRLRDFSPGNAEGAEFLARHYAGRHVDFVAALADPEKRAQDRSLRETRYRKFHPEVTEDQLSQAMESQERAREERLNKRVLRTIQRDHGVINDSTEANTFFQTARQIADAAVRGHAEHVFPDNEGALLQDEITGELSPAELLQRYFDSSADERTRFELKRQFLLADIAMQERHHFNETAKRKLEQIETFLKEKFYKNPDGKPVPMQMWGVFDNKTNAMEMGGNDSPLFLYSEPQGDAPEGKHYKVINIAAMELKNGGHIVVLRNIKKEDKAARKPLRKAMSRVGYPNDDVINVAGDMQDTHRLKIVYIGGQEATDRFSERFFDELTDPKNAKYFYDFGENVIDEDHIPIGAPTGKGEIQYGAKPGIGKSPKKVNYTKLILEYAGTKNPFKMVVQPVHSFIAEQLETGQFDPDVGKMDGPAWEMVAVQREIPLSEILAPVTVYDGLQRQEPGSPIPHPELAGKVEELLASKELTLAA